MVLETTYNMSGTIYMTHYNKSDQATKPDKHYASFKYSITWPSFNWIPRFCSGLSNDSPLLNNTLLPIFQHCFCKTENIKIW